MKYELFRKVERITIKLTLFSKYAKHSLFGNLIQRSVKSINSRIRSGNADRSLEFDCNIS